MIKRIQRERKTPAKDRAMAVQSETRLLVPPGDMQTLHAMMKSIDMSLCETFIPIGNMKTGNITAGNMFLVQDVVGRVFYNEDEMITFLEMNNLTGGVFVKTRTIIGQKLSREIFTTTTYGSSLEDALTNAITRVVNRRKIVGSFTEEIDHGGPDADKQEKAY